MIFLCSLAFGWSVSIIFTVRAGGGGVGGGCKAVSTRISNRNKYLCQQYPLGTEHYSCTFKIVVPAGAETNFCFLVAWSQVPSGRGGTSGQDRGSPNRTVYHPPRGQGYPLDRTGVPPPPTPPHGKQSEATS